MFRFLFFLCTEFLQFLGRVFHITYKEISVYFNLYLQGFILMLSAILPLGFALCHAAEMGMSAAEWLVTAGLAIYAALHVWGFIAMLRHYRGTIDEAFDRCVSDLLRLAAAWHTTYIAVNIIIFILAFLCLCVGHALLCVWISTWPLGS